MLPTVFEGKSLGRALYRSIALGRVSEYPKSRDKGRDYISWTQYPQSRTRAHQAEIWGRALPQFYNRLRWVGMIIGNRYTNHATLTVQKVRVRHLGHLRRTRWQLLNLLECLE